MATQDTCVTIHPYFKIKSGHHDEFKQLSEQCVEKASNEDLCLYYGFSFNGDSAHCREGYTNADGLLFHLKNVDLLLQELLKIADLERLEIHGSESELAKLRVPLAEMNPQFFCLEYGFRK